MSLLFSLLGMVVLLGVAIAFSENRKAISLRTVGAALTLQVVIGALVLFWDTGAAALQSLSNSMNALIELANEGIGFVFGGLISDKMFDIGVGFIFGVRVLPLIIFFSSLIAVLYYLRIMPVVIQVIGGAISKITGTSRSESLSATANIFVGHTEAPLVIRPFLSTMTRSELFAVMVGGMASVAGSVLAGYAFMGADMKYLIAASFMAAPGGLLMAKLIVPETSQPNERIEEILAEDEEKPSNVIDAAAAGASRGMHLALNVGAMLIAFVGLIAALNALVGLVGGMFGFNELSIQSILGYAFYPIAWIIGVPTADALEVGSLIGQKLVLNEFVAFADFQGIKENLSPLAQAIATFALCGFANFSSVAILLGGIGGLAPARRVDIARLGLKAVLAGTLSNLMSATIAGLFLGLTLAS
jgi:CNT family concentrative nucleoside transporter